MVSTDSFVNDVSTDQTDNIVTTDSNDNIDQTTKQTSPGCHTMMSAQGVLLCHSFYLAYNLVCLVTGIHARLCHRRILEIQEAQCLDGTEMEVVADVRLNHHIAVGRWLEDRQVGNHAGAHHALYVLRQPHAVSLAVGLHLRTRRKISQCVLVAKDSLQQTVASALYLRQGVDDLSTSGYVVFIFSIFICVFLLLVLK